MAVEPVSVTRVPARPVPLIKIVDCYSSWSSIPAPPADKPWLRPGGVYELDAERELCVNARLVERKTRSGDTVKFYIMAFQAVRMGMSKTFANSMRAQAARERDALIWLHSDASLPKEKDEGQEKEKAQESDEPQSETDSTFAQALGTTRHMRQMQQILGDGTTTSRQAM